MSDLIKLACQGCGAPLQAGRDLLHAVCPYCKTDNIIKQSEGRILEAVSQCPICHRNDRTKKVSAIMASGGENRGYFAPPQKPQHPQQAINQPPPPGPVQQLLNSSNSLRTAFIVFCVLAGLSLMCTLSSIRSNGGYGFFFVIIFGLTAFFLYSRDRKEKQKVTHTRNAYQDQLSQYQTHLDSYHQGIQQQRSAEEELYQKWLILWEAALEKWKQVYYCDRDDCVFIPGKENTAPLKDIEKFCYQKDE